MRSRSGNRLAWRASGNRWPHEPDARESRAPGDPGAQAPAAPAPGPRRIPAGIGRGLRLGVDFETDTRLYLGVYEIELNRHLRRLCTPGTPSFDVGGCRGYDALVLARLTGSPGRVIRGGPGCLRADACELLVERRGLPDTDRRGDRGRPGADVTLDGSTGEFGAPGFIKIDVDGGELDVLRGAEEDPRRTPAVADRRDPFARARAAVRTLPGDRGYKPVVVKQRTVWRERRPDDNRWLVAPAPVPRRAGSLAV